MKLEDLQQIAAMSVGERMQVLPVVRFLDQVRAEPAAPGARVLTPGDLEAASTAERRERGIPLEDEEQRALERLAGPLPRETSPPA